MGQFSSIDFKSIFFGILVYLCVDIVSCGPSIFSKCFMFKLQIIFLLNILHVLLRWCDLVLYYYSIFINIFHYHPHQEWGVPRRAIITHTLTKTTKERDNNCSESKYHIFVDDIQALWLRAIVVFKKWRRSIARVFITAVITFLQLWVFVDIGQSKDVDASSPLFTNNTRIPRHCCERSLLSVTIAATLQTIKREENRTFLYTISSNSYHTTVTFHGSKYLWRHVFECIGTVLRHSLTRVSMTWRVIYSIKKTT